MSIFFSFLYSNTSRPPKSDRAGVGRYQVRRSSRTLAFRSRSDRSRAGKRDAGCRAVPATMGLSVGQNPRTISQASSPLILTAASPTYYSCWRIIASLLLLLNNPPVDISSNPSKTKNSRAEPSNHYHVHKLLPVSHPPLLNSHTIPCTSNL